MYLYVILARFPGCPSRSLEDMRAAVQLLKECHGARTRGPAPMGLGLVYETPARVPEQDMATLGVMEFH